MSRLSCDAVAARAPGRSWRERVAAGSRALFGKRWVQQAVWMGDPPRARWHSFDRTPWRHPWLTPANLRRARKFSDQILAQAADIAQQAAGQDLRFGFVGNIANNLYMRAVALRRAGLDVTVFPAPYDDYVMSDPGWEEYDGTLPPGVTTLSELARAGISLPSPAGVFRAQAGEGLASIPGARLLDSARWPAYRLPPALAPVQRMDALLSIQFPFLAHLSGRPYLVSQAGGDIWYECSRDDALGRLQRHSFARAGAFLASNPWSYAHARRYGMRHLVYLPMVIDETVYCAGPSDCRGEWEARTGGSFFVLSTSRADDFFKGTGTALDGYARFARDFPGARLVMLGWGKDLDAHRGTLSSLGIADKVLVLPVSGKKRILQYLRAADCLLDQFVLGYFGATALEAMGCALPIVMRIERAQYDALCETGAPPVLDVDSAEGVRAALEGLARDRGARDRAAAAHREWLVANHGGRRWHGQYRDLLTATALGHRFDFRGSPLAEPLSAAETEYHRAELANAPAFPNYY